MCIHFGRRRDNSAWDAVNCMLCPRQVKSTTVQFHAQCVSRIAPPRTKALILMICWFRALVGRSDGFQHLGQMGGSDDHQDESPRAPVVGVQQE